MVKTNVNIFRSSLIVLILGFLALVAFFALGSLAHEDEETALVCYAEKGCANNSSVSCIVVGEDCDAVVTDAGVFCTGELEDGTWGTVKETCPKG